MSSFPRKAKITIIWNTYTGFTAGVKNKGEGGSLKFARVLELIHGEAPGGFPDQEKGKYLVDTHTAACMLK